MRYKIDTERADLFDVNIVITMKVSLNRVPSFDEGKIAFDKACACHEVLNSRVVIEQSGDAYYVDCDAPANEFTTTELSLEKLIGSCEKERFRIENGEFIRGFLVPDGIVFMMHHLAGDGKSLLYFIETFMKCLEGKECEFISFRSLTMEDLPKSSKLPFVYSALTSSWNRKWSRVKRVFDFKDMEVSYEKFWKENSTVTKIKRYDKDELDALVKTSKEYGVSLTSYLITDMIKDSKKTMDVGLAVDGRIDKNRAMGNQATGISVKYRYDAGKTFERNCRAVHKLMRKKLDDDRYRYFVLQFIGRIDPCLRDAMNLERAGYFTSKISSKAAGIMGYGKNVKDLSITNLTRADIPLQYGEFAINEIAFIPPVISYAKDVIGIVTAGDVMIVTRRVYEN